MKKVTCFINCHGFWHKDLFPYRLECYPHHTGKRAVIERRDFDCLTIKEAKSIAKAIYGKQAHIVF